jgi:hypothetical protein
MEPRKLGELKRLVAEEEVISGHRAELHRRIRAAHHSVLASHAGRRGLAEQERVLSGARRRLHDRIDQVLEELGLVRGIRRERQLARVVLGLDALSDSGA